ncbi:glycosyl hydrolase family 28-related protein [Sphingomonas sp. BIUV-7]|uniref:Glycosyl hydrolase family 28-related protein n=1 Tax=Sphingomonas natans TaxID=3063330 RepID=A0ABT8Y3I2_9SPHN|nr:glycosyl hydrolase family 28-related protein [Sphingomonas sp. BIUV-7]MDO6412870.1 glycosyl hydrolase family 28-related protein [Sphingomonas sp. BIUV-7]
MITRRDVTLALATSAAAALAPFPAHAARVFDVRKLGARGDGVTLDTDAVNAAIEAAARAGGGTVLFPAGRYLCFTIRLKSRITLMLAKGAVIEAADPARHPGKYDLPEEEIDQLYQDYGHSYWRNSLIWGDGVEDVAIVGPGLIHGVGLTRHGPGARWKSQTGERPLSMKQMPAKSISELEPAAAAMRDQGNKAIALKNGRNIRLSGFSMLKCGHFAILATGTQKLTITDLQIDTDRDGIDLDCTKGVLVERCRVNTPNDDGIVVKATYALGRSIAAEDIVIRHCAVSGYDLGTMLDGTRGTTMLAAPDRDRPTGRIKLGTESTGGYAHVLIEDCTFDHCRGLALETVDGGAMTDVTARRLVMRDVTTAPIFLRIGDRRRGPPGTGIGSIRDVTISDITATGIDHRFPASIAGLPGHPVEAVTLRNIDLTYNGGGTAEDAALVPPEVPTAYPEPSMFGVLPSWGLWVRHARDITVDGLKLQTATPDARPPFKIEDAPGLKATRTPLWRD